MTKKPLYRYQDGEQTIVTPIQRNPEDPIYKVRLIADEGMVLTDGEVTTPCIDCALNEVENWEEIPKKDEQ